MKYVEYLRNVKKFDEDHVNYMMRQADFYGAYEDYLKHCINNEIKHEPYEDVFFAETW